MTARYQAHTERATSDVATASVGAGPAARSLPPVQLGADPGTVLVVDDDPINCDMLRRRLVRHGYRVVTANSGPQALGEIARQPFDLVLLDVMMPDVSGLDTLRRIRDTYASSELPVIMATAKGMSEDVVEAMSLGASDYITKPIDFPVALARIKAHVSTGRATRALKASEHRYALAAKGDNSGHWDWTPATGALRTSPRFLEIAGVPADQTGPTTWPEWMAFLYPDDRARVESHAAELLSSPCDQCETDFRIERPDGEPRWVVCRGAVDRDATGRVLRFVGSLFDVTTERTIAKETGLPNRRRVIDVCSRSLARHHATGQAGPTVIVIGIDRLGQVNEALGARRSQALRQDIVRRLTTDAPRHDLLADLDGNDFCLVIDGASTDADLKAAVSAIQSAFARPFDVSGREVLLGAAAGAAVGDAEYSHAEDLLRDACIALSEARTTDTGGYCLFDDAMRTARRSAFETAGELRQAIDAGALALHYQPIVNLTTGLVDGFEALVRWPHPVRGLLPPSAFLELAETYGLMASLGRWGLLEACRQTAEWRRAGGALSQLTINVNVSPTQFHQSDIVADVRAALDAGGLPPSALVIEITESAVMRDMRTARATLAALRDLGVRFAMDDFGVGHSTLSHLSELSFHKLKIDRSFISRMTHTTDDREIVKAVLTLAQALDMSVTAEGIETADQLSDLRALNCATGQGYLLSRPLPASDVQAFLTAHRAGFAGANTPR